MVPISLIDRGIVRAGMEVYDGDRLVGWVTSGTMVPYHNFDEAGNILDTTGKRAIGFAYIDSVLVKGDTVQIDIRGKRVRAQIVNQHMRQDLPPYGRAVLL